MFRKILFDVDGTLLDFEASAGIALREAFKLRGYPFSDEILAKYHTINNRMWQAYERGEMPREKVLTERFTLIFSEMGIDEKGETFDPVFRKGLEDFPIMVEGAKEILDELKTSYDLYVVTNGVAKTQEARMKKTGLDAYMKDVFISEKIGYQKPQREFFDQVLERLGNPPLDELILVGDSLSADILGANRAGITSVWFNPERKKNPGTAFPDFEIRQLSELKIIL